MGRAREVEARPPTTNSYQPRVKVSINDNFCVNVARNQETVLYVTHKKQTLDIYQTFNVNSPVANYVLIVGGLPQKKGVIPDIVKKMFRLLLVSLLGVSIILKYVKDVSCVDYLCFVQNFRNSPMVAPGLHVGARLYQFWEIWAALWASPKVITVLGDGYTLS